MATTQAQRALEALQQHRQSCRWTPACTDLRGYCPRGQALCAAWRAAAGILPREDAREVRDRHRRAHRAANGVRSLTAIGGAPA